MQSDCAEILKVLSIFVDKDCNKYELKDKHLTF